MSRAYEPKTKRTVEHEVVATPEKNSTQNIDVTGIMFTDWLFALYERAFYDGMNAREVDGKFAKPKREKMDYALGALPFALPQSVVEQKLKRDMKKNQLLSPIQAAEFLGMSRSMLDRLKRQGLGPSYLKNDNGISSRVFYSIKALNEWVEKKQIKTC